MDNKILDKLTRITSNYNKSTDTIEDVISITISMGVAYQKIVDLEWDRSTDVVRYKVENTPLCCYGQHIRARVGVKFFDVAVDNNPQYTFYTKVFDMCFRDNNLTKFGKRTFEVLASLEKLRINSQFKSPYDLMSRNVSYSVEQTYQSIKGQMLKRLKFCEEEFICGLHFLLRHKLIEAGCEKANELVPACDIINRCDYSSADYLSNIFGCLFAGCGRWPDEAHYSTFNESCTSRHELENQLKIEIPKSKYENLITE